MGVWCLQRKVHKTELLLWLRYAPNSLSAGASPQTDPTGGAYSAPPDPLAGLGGEAAWGRGRREGRGKGEERRGREGERRG